MTGPASPDRRDDPTRRNRARDPGGALAVEGAADRRGRHLGGDRGVPLDALVASPPGTGRGGGAARRPGAGRLPPRSGRPGEGERRALAGAVGGRVVGPYGVGR